MGSLPEGTHCAFCDSPEASYIPDWHMGASCPDCWDRGIEDLDTLRLSRFLASLGAVCRPSSGPVEPDFLALFGPFLDARSSSGGWQRVETPAALARGLALCLFRVTDPQNWLSASEVSEDRAGVIDPPGFWDADVNVSSGRGSDSGV